MWPDFFIVLGRGHGPVAGAAIAGETGQAGRTAHRQRSGGGGRRQIEGWCIDQQAQQPPSRSTQVALRNFDLIYHRSAAPLRRDCHRRTQCPQDGLSIPCSGWPPGERGRLLSENKIHLISATGRTGKESVCQILLEKERISISPLTVFLRRFTPPWS